MPYRVSVNPCLNKTFADKMLSNLRDGPTSTAATATTLHLIGDGSVPITPGTALADMTAVECDFTGYASASTALSDTVNLDTDVQAVLAQHAFVAGTSTAFTAGTVSGYWLQGGGDWLVAEQFDVADQVPIASPGDFVDVAVAVKVIMREPGA